MYVVCKLVPLSHVVSSTESLTMRLRHNLFAFILLFILTCILCSCRNKTRAKNTTKIKAACNRTKENRQYVVDKKSKSRSRALVSFGSKPKKKQCSPKINKRASIPTKQPAKFSCPNDAPILAHSLQKAENPRSIYCRKQPFPCTKNCYEAKTCSLLGRHDFMVKYECDPNADVDDYDPFQCKRRCCRSNATELRNCTWHYTTDGKIGKGKDVPLAVRNIDFSPFIIEVCAVHKKNDSDICAIGWPLEGVEPPVEVVQPLPVEPNPIQVVPDGSGGEIFAGEGADLGNLGLLASLGIAALLALRGCNPIDIIFIVDGSHSVFKSGFDNELRFVKGVLGYFDFSAKSAKQSRAALIVSGSSDFQSPTKTIFDLTTYASSNTANADLSTKISGIKYPDNVASDSNVAVNMASSLFQSGTKRAGVRRVTILMTDGIGDHVKAATLATVISNLQGVTGEVIYAVETTTNIAGELTSQVGIPEDHTTYPPSFSDLPVVAPVVVNQICTKITATSMGASTVAAATIATAQTTKITAVTVAQTTAPAATTAASTSTTTTAASTTTTTASTTTSTTGTSTTTTKKTCCGVTTGACCSTSSDCCSVNTATTTINPKCISNAYCACIIQPDTFPASYGETCCDSSPLYFPSPGYIACPLIGINNLCNALSPAPCKAGLICTPDAPALLSLLNTTSSSLGFCRPISG